MLSEYVIKYTSIYHNPIGQRPFIGKFDVITGRDFGISIDSMIKVPLVNGLLNRHPWHHTNEGNYIDKSNDFHIYPCCNTDDMIYLFFVCYGDPMPEEYFAITFEDAYSIMEIMIGCK